ncbi:hypothetical protein GIB67_026325 [Kingdonia uniflora]|uniref:N-acetyltransferase domain-containing protein n=1 Tax=Kingdonia uniflora TaxID=39325 RepID=A0A7J7N5S2_9MAGN|nr:hypothetical protein GIB67_026325 [Kingdonia uniflora]
MQNTAKMIVLVREYDETSDKRAVEELERQCEVGSGGKMSLTTDHMGDPVCRVRHTPLYTMLVAELRDTKEIVGVIRGSLKTVTRGKKLLNDCPDYVKVAYILGLRVSHAHRRLGIGMKLVEELEEWCKQNGAEYAYMATDYSNTASINLFTLKCAYDKFRTPTVLVHPVHAHYKSLGSGVKILKLNTKLAESIYGGIFTNYEFFPKDIGVLLSNKLNLGTFMAVPYLSEWGQLEGQGHPYLPPSFAILSIWNTKEVFKLQVKGVSPLIYACCAGSRVIDTWLPILKIPSVPNVFKPFGVYFLYGLYMNGKGGAELLKSLCAFAHNMGRDDTGCGAVVAEVGQCDPARVGVPHWKSFSWAEDIWCMKKLITSENQDEGSSVTDWIKSRPSTSIIFVDPRDF